MATSEIEKLERRYAENPHGLTFAPLAEVHRKNGDVARALELLTAGLELHPNYIPASIVLGRCHQDLGDLPSAEDAFAHVLRLDDENVIALKSLADISEREERYGEAESWLRRLVSVDRSNEEAHEQLRRVEAAKQGGAPKQIDEEGAVEVPAPSPALEMIDLSPEPAVASEGSGVAEIAALELTQEAASASRQDVVAPEAEPAETPRLPYIAGLEPDSESQAPAAALPDGVSAPPAEPAPAAAAAALETEDTARQEETVRPIPGLISAEFQPPLEATGGLGVETSEEVVLEMSGNSEYRVPDASEDFKSLAARLSAPPAPPPAEPAWQPVPGAGEPPSKPRAEPELVVTEAGAEVFLQQGQHSYLAHDTKGQSVAAFFQALLAARPPSEPGSSAKGTAPGRDAGAVTPSPRNPGSPTSASGEENLPAPPAVPAGEEQADGVVSFDDFFGSKGDGSTPLRQGKTDPGKDDLDQFQTWLQNLKR